MVTTQDSAVQCTDTYTHLHEIVFHSLMLRKCTIYSYNEPTVIATSRFRCSVFEFVHHRAVGVSGRARTRSRTNLYTRAKKPTLFKNPVFQCKIVLSINYCTVKSRSQMYSTDHDCTVRYTTQAMCPAQGQGTRIPQLGFLVPRILPESYHGR